MNNMNNNNGKRNFRRFNKNNNNRHRHGGPRFSSNSDDGSDINPQMRRNFEMKRSTHLAKAKELLSAGERVDAEWHLQHADHYFRMANLGLDKQRQFAQPQSSGSGNQSLDAAPAVDSVTPTDDLRFISDAPVEKTTAPTTGIADLPFMQN